LAVEGAGSVRSRWREDLGYTVIDVGKHISPGLCLPFCHPGWQIFHATQIQGLNAAQHTWNTCPLHRPLFSLVIGRVDTILCMDN
jgi:hypothetical protein